MTRTLAASASLRGPLAVDFVQQDAGSHGSVERSNAATLRNADRGVAQTAQFVADASPDAYEKLVDRLLASPHYGERQARHWLDLARYADSNGFTIDGARQIWPWRKSDE